MYEGIRHFVRESVVLGPCYESVMLGLIYTTGSTVEPEQRVTHSFSSDNYIVK